MFQINSERLRLIALSHKELLLLQIGRNELERSLGLAISDFRLNYDDRFLFEFREVIANYTTPKVAAYPETFQWWTHWLIVEKSTNLTIGGIGGSGLPNEQGQVMIGYFIDAKSEGKGYATEALKCFTDWMFGTVSLKAVIADTLADGLASQKVLRKAGFSLLGPVEEGLRWQLSR